MANISNFATGQTVFIRPRLPPCLTQSPGCRPASIAHSRVPSLLQLLVAATAAVIFASIPDEALAAGAIMLIAVIVLFPYHPPISSRASDPAAPAHTRPRRRARIVADRRPILLRPVIVLAPSRRTPRILGPAPIVIPYALVRRRPIGGFNREARIQGPLTPHRRAPIRLCINTLHLRPADYGNDNLPPGNR